MAEGRPYKERTHSPTNQYHIHPSPASPHHPPLTINPPHPIHNTIHQTSLIHHPSPPPPEAGLSVAVLEAALRAGGRIHTIHDGSESIELGAEFVHGRPPELWSLIEEAGLETYESSGPNLSFEDGHLVSAS